MPLDETYLVVGEDRPAGAYAYAYGATISSPGKYVR
jgi:hypothetical protein